MVRVCIFENTQHNTVDGLDEVIGLEVDAPFAKRFSNGCFILIFEDELLQDELSSNCKHLSNVPDHVTVLQCLLEQVQLVVDLVWYIFVAPFQHGDISLEDCCEDDLRVVLKFRGDLIRSLNEQRLEETEGFIVGWNQPRKMFTQWAGRVRA